ncbi:hypothetical protein EMCG_04145 [[Emmonsia] crescens]|uniref:Uncharacterized protein n=1 Tax=[Emmonsia] crescens TaxID=73230 RepID=A0A0G2HT06_9EURO|nr:hypothetical protein EMCG_04145 [Emmonsia crescens UAMH 3008]
MRVLVHPGYTFHRHETTPMLRTRTIPNIFMNSYPRSVQVLTKLSIFGNWKMQIVLRSSSETLHCVTQIPRFPGQSAPMKPISISLPKVKPKKSNIQLPRIR